MPFFYLTFKGENSADGIYRVILEAWKILAYTEVREFSKTE